MLIFGSSPRGNSPAQEEKFRELHMFDDEMLDLIDEIEDDMLALDPIEVDPHEVLYGDVIPSDDTLQELADELDMVRVDIDLDELMA